MPPPGFGSRLRTAAKTITGLFSDRSATEAFGLLPGLYPSASGPIVQRGTRELLEGYSKMPWLRAVSQKIGETVAATEWQLLQPTSEPAEAAVRVAKMIRNPTTRANRLHGLVSSGEARIITEHPLLDALHSANEMLVGQALMHLTQVYLDLVGECFWIKERNAIGVIVGFWPIPPHWIRTTPTVSYRAYQAQWAAWQGDIPDTEIVWFKHADPANPYARGTGIGRTLADELETDEYAARHCHDDQTECLTRRGWVNGLDLLDTDEIATWNPTSQRTEYHKPLHITRARYVGDMHYWNGQRVDACVTPTHRLWIERRQEAATNNRRQPLPQGWHFEESQQALSTPGKPFYWRDTGRYDGGAATIEIPAVSRITKRKAGSRGGGRPPQRGVNDPLVFDTVAFAAWLGYYVSEGSVGRAGLQVCQSEGRYVDDIRQALTVFPPTWTHEKYRSVREKAHWSPSYKWQTNHLGLAEWVRKEVGSGAANKRLPPVVFEWTRAAQLELLRTLINGDGSRNRRRDPSRYFSISEGLLDDVQRLCVQVGWSAYKAPNRHHGGHYLNIRSDEQVRLLNTKGGRKNDGRSWCDIVPYDGIVWCVTVPNELFFSRRNGRVMLGGNTRMTFLNRARPDLIVWPEETKHDSGQITSETASRLAEKWRSEHQGFWKAALPYFATRKLGIKEIGQSFDDLQLVELRKHERDIIVQTYGMPPEELGITESSNRATATVSEFIFKKNLIVPRLEFIRANIQERLVPEYDERLVFAYVSPVQEDREVQAEMAKAFPDTLMIDDWRQLQGFEPLPDEKGQVLLISTTRTPVTDPTMPPIPLAISAPAIGGPPTQRGKAFPDELSEFRASLHACRDAGDVETAKALVKFATESSDNLPALVARAAAQEPGFKRAIRERLATLAAGGTDAELERAIPGGTTTVLHVLGLVGWTSMTKELLTPLLKTAYLGGAREGASQAELTIGHASATASTVVRKTGEVPWNVVNPLAESWAREAGAELVSGIDDQLKDVLRELLGDALNAGLGAADTARRIRQVVPLTMQQADAVSTFAAKLLAQNVAATDVQRRTDAYAAAQLSYRSTVIARTETMTASNVGQRGLWNAAKAQGLLQADAYERQWLATDDDRLCDDCEPYDKTTVGFDEEFDDGDPPLHPNCRCTTGLVAASSRDDVEADALRISVRKARGEQISERELSDLVQRAIDSGFSDLAAAVRSLPEGRG